MRQALGTDDFLASPIGRYVVGRTWLYFYPHEALSGWLVWGRPVAGDFEDLARVFPAAHSKTSKPHGLLIDARHLEVFEPETFGAAASHVTTHQASLRIGVTRLALIRPDGLVGAAATGFFAMAGAPYPVEIFDEPTEALRWLGREIDAPILDELDALRGAASGVAPLVRDLRAVLDVRVRIALSEIAARLGLSPRSLQRRLEEAGTSLKNETNLARVRAASRILRETDASVTKVAFEVGCASPQHFSTLFRRVTGEAPSAWRARHRR